MSAPDSNKSPSEGQNYFWAIWAVVAAFGTYFCMYGFRKPYTAASFEGLAFGGIEKKTLIVSIQIFGYTLSKFIGIKVISEMPPHRRAMAILALIGVAQTSLLLFGLLPEPWNAGAMFFNGLALGMVFGLVIGFLEGRQLTEALTAGLCASFVLADGVTKSVGTWLLQVEISEYWMPFVAGLIYLLPLCLSVALLARIPGPDQSDIVLRNQRASMNATERWKLFRRFGFGITAIVIFYLLLTVIRSVRSDFAPELWKGLGVAVDEVPSTFTTSEFYVALGLFAANGFIVFIRDNRLAFFVSLATCLSGFLLIGGALTGLYLGQLSAFPFMVLIGLGLYIPYVTIHTTVFERLLAMTRAKGNLGFLMYVADAFGYLGYVGVMIAGNLWSISENFLQFFIGLCWLTCILSLVCLGLAWRYFSVQGHPIDEISVSTGASK